MDVVPAGLARQPASWRGTPDTTPPPKTGAAPGVYRRHQPETTALYEVVRDNLETLWPKDWLRASARSTTGRLRSASPDTRGKNSSPTSTVQARLRAVGRPSAATPGRAYGRPKCPPRAPRPPAVVGIDWQTALVSLTLTKPSAGVKRAPRC